MEPRQKTLCRVGKGGAVERLMIFVFGSNLAGRHGKGAAFFALRNHGAEYGVGFGPTGNAYAIPTKTATFRIMTIDEIRPYMSDFFKYASEHAEKTFLLTPVGCGLAGHKKVDMLRLIREFDISDNVVFDRRWFKE